MDWKKNESTQIEQFKVWLAARRPPEIKPIEKRGGGSGKKTIKSELKALGAYRLLKKMDWEKSRDHSCRIIGKKLANGEWKALYEFQSEWVTAQKKAEDIISNLGVKTGWGKSI
jgi:hypothetical protein